MGRPKVLDLRRLKNSAVAKILRSNERQQNLTNYITRPTCFKPTSARLCFFKATLGQTGCLASTNFESRPTYVTTDEISIVHHCHLFWLFDCHNMTAHHSCTLVFYKNYPISSTSESLQSQLDIRDTQAITYGVIDSPSPMTKFFWIYYFLQLLSRLTRDTLTSHKHV